MKRKKSAFFSLSGHIETAWVNLEVSLKPRLHVEASVAEVQTSALSNFSTKNGFFFKRGPEL